MICERCNTENLDGSQYCDECGAVLAGIERARKADTGPTGEDEAMLEENPAVSLPGAGSGEAAVRLSEVRAPRTSTGPFVAAPETPEHAEGNNNSHGAVPAGVSAESFKAAQSAVSAHAKLVIHRGRSVGKEFPLSEDETHIGRWDADGGIFPDVDLDSDDPEAKVSRRHARITRRGEQYYIEDLGSTNGTFINRGRRLLPGDRQSLKDGDEVIVGKTFLRFNVIK